MKVFLLVRYRAVNKTFTFPVRGLEVKKWKDVPFYLGDVFDIKGIGRLTVRGIKWENKGPINVQCSITRADTTFRAKALEEYNNKMAIQNKLAYSDVRMLL